MKNLSFIISVIIIIIAITTTALAQKPTTPTATLPLTKTELDSIRNLMNTKDLGSQATIEDLLNMKDLITADVAQKFVHREKYAPKGDFARLKKQVNRIDTVVDLHGERLKCLESKINIARGEIELAKDSLGQMIEQMKCGHIKKEEIHKEIEKLRIKKEELDNAIEEKETLLENY